MKKILYALFILTLMISTCSCSSKPKGTELTLENYEQYLAIESYSGASSKGKTCGSYLPPDGGGHGMSDLAHFGLKITGASTNYDYENVELEIQVKGTIDVYHTKDGSEFHNMGYSDADLIIDPQPIDDTITVKCNIGGDAEELLEYPVNGAVRNDNVKLDYEITKVSGTVTKTN